MKKITLSFLIILLALSMAGCRSSSNLHLPAPVGVAKYKTINIDVIYDPLLLVTIEDKKGIVEDFTPYINAMGFAVVDDPDAADMILRITIEDLVLTERNKRLFDRTSFGLSKGGSFMKYSASFVDAKTFEEIISNENELKTKLYFLSKEEVKEKFFSEMREEIIDFMIENKVF